MITDLIKVEGHPMKAKAILVALLTIHAFLSAWAALRLSPTWDEIGYPVSGYLQLTTGSVHLSPQNPFLSRLLSGVPLLFLPVDPQFKTNTQTFRDASEAGYAFTFKQKTNPRIIVFLGRLSPLIFSLALALVFYLWGRRLWGEHGGLLLVLSYLLVPILNSRASLALLEMPMYFFLMLALFIHQKWFETHQTKNLVMTGVVLGLALLCKLVALPGLFAILLLEVFYPQPSHSIPSRLKTAGILTLVTLVTVMISYLPWQGGWTLFQGTIKDIFIFNQTLPTYFSGSTLKTAPPFLTLLFVLIKAPIFLCVLSLMGFYMWMKKGNYTSTRHRFVLFFLIYMATGISLGLPVSTIQLSPLYLAVVFLCGGLTDVIQLGRTRDRLLVAVLFLLALWDGYRAYPNQLAYFNQLVGGPRQGYRWLADSDQDWGQGLPLLAEYLKKKGNPVVFLSQSSAGDPAAYKIRYLDVFSPALVSREKRVVELDPGNIPQWLVISTKVMQAYPELVAWPRDNLKPEAMVGYCYFIYNITSHPEAREWVAEIFRLTGREVLAQKLLTPQKRS